jgi:hypothetical protein
MKWDLVTHLHLSCASAHSPLGKTLQTISYISYLTTELKIPGPHLIVVPLSVLFNWILEFRSFCPSLRIVRVHSNNAADQQRLRDILTSLSRYTGTSPDSEDGTSSASDAPSSCPYDVVVTTYEMVKGKLETNLKRVYWRTMVLDEGHRIKNDEALITKACVHYKARFKIVLTGSLLFDSCTSQSTQEHQSKTIFMKPTLFCISSTHISFKLQKHSTRPFISLEVTSMSTSTSSIRLTISCVYLFFEELKLKLSKSSHQSSRLLSSVR